MEQFLYLRSMGAVAVTTLLIVSGASQAQTNLLANGTFGTTSYQHNAPSIFNPSMAGWTSTGSMQPKTQTVAYGCTQFYCFGGTAHNWYCGGNSSGLMRFSTSQFANNLAPNTRYQLSFHAFRDLTGLSSTDPTYSQSPALGVLLKSSGGNIWLKDAKAANFNFNSYRPGFDKAFTYEFKTPVDAGNNLSSPNLEFQWNSQGKYNLCFTGVQITPLSDTQNPSRVVVNTEAYAKNGNKIATLVMPQGSNLSGLKWRLRYGNGLPPVSYSVSIRFHPVVTGSDGMPLRNADGSYTLQTNADGTLKTVGGTGTGGQGSYTPPTSVLPATALVRDPDSGDYTYTLDFSSFGPTVVTTSNPKTDGTVTPSAFTGPDGQTYYILSGSTTTSSASPGSLFWIDVLDGSGNLIAKSNEFTIADNPYRSLKNDALYSFYHQRSGTAIAPSFNAAGLNLEHNALARPAGHTTEIAGCWKGADKNGVITTIDLWGNNWGDGGSGCNSINTDFSGGWYDAADHGKYVVNGGIALWTLQNQIERLLINNKLDTQFPDQSMKFPANNLSDLMDEAKYEMDWMLKMQILTPTIMKVPLKNQAKKQTAAPYGQAGTPGVFQVKRHRTPVAPGQDPDSGAFIEGESPVPHDAAGDLIFNGGKIPRLKMKLALTDVDVNGMVFHAIQDQRWTGLPLAPAADTQPRVLMYPTTAATLNFAAVAAQCSRIWTLYSGKLSNRGLTGKASEALLYANNCKTRADAAFTAAKAFRSGSSNGNTNNGHTLAAGSDILRFEYTNQGPTDAGGNWTSADKVWGLDATSGTFKFIASNKNTSTLQYGFALTPQFDGGGAYGDLRVSDEFIWAATELDLAYQTNTYTAGLPAKPAGDTECTMGSTTVQCYNWITGFDWQNVSPLATMSLALNGNTAAKTALRNYADTLLGLANSQGYHFPKRIFSATDTNTQYEWGSNGNILNRAVILGAAYDTLSSSNTAADITKRNNYQAAMEQTMGFLLGRNGLEQSYISGYGKKATANAHHRWFAKHASVAYPKIPAGFIAGGANTRDIAALRANAPRYLTNSDVTFAIANGDLGAVLGGISDLGERFFEEQILPQCLSGLETGITHTSPLRCHADHYRSFATNEIAVNWQASLFWVSQHLSELHP